VFGVLISSLNDDKRFSVDKYFALSVGLKCEFQQLMPVTISSFMYQERKMKMSIDEIYSKYYNTTAVSALNDISSVQSVKTDDESSSETVGSVSASKTDTYVSTITSQDTELRSENYNDIINQIRQAKAAMASKEAASDADEDYSSLIGGTDDSTSESESAGSASASGSVGGAGGSGGGSSSDDDEEETTTIVVINGQRYLETTTTNADGSTTVTRTPIGATDDGSGTTDFSAAAESVGM
jgi:hypothetical protein